MSDSKSVLVAGCGISGVAAAKILLDKGASVVMFDSNKKLNPDDIKEKIGKKYEITVIVGTLNENDLNNVRLCVISPGISMEEPFVAQILKAEIPVWSEIELAYHYAKGRLAAITGTNGKTTTTALVGDILKTYYNEVFIAGNIGIPYTKTALSTTDKSVTVAEVSSFQLETICDFHPNVSAILNITPDHLNRHKTMECYIQTKERIAENQTKKDVCILNYEDEALREFGSRVKARTVFFSSKRELDEGFYLYGNNIIYKHNGKKLSVINVKELRLLGIHNYENVMAAVAISVEMGVPAEQIIKAVKNFNAVEHRIEYVSERAGVKYYNDSKGTNPDAAIQAIKAMPGPTLLIAGGYDKQSEYDEWFDSFDGKVRYLVLIGQTRDKIAACAKRHGFFDIIYAEDMMEAVRVCASYANKGDNVLLSPACASWGMFKNYEERGKIFKECVQKL